MTKELEKLENPLREHPRCPSNRLQTRQIQLEIQRLLSRLLFQFTYGRLRFLGAPACDVHFGVLR